MANYVKKIGGNYGAGDRIRMPRLGRLGVRAFVPGNPVHYQSRTETEWMMEVDRYMESSFPIQDIVRIQSHTNLRNEYTNEAGRALAEDIDNFLLAQRAAVIGYSSSSHIVSSSPIDYPTILAANTILDKRKVPQEGRVLIVGVGHKAGLLNEPKFIHKDYGQISDISRGTIGEILGVPVVLTSNLTINSLTGYTNGDDGTPAPTPGMAGSPYYPTQSDFTITPLTANYYSAILCHPEWLAFWPQKMPMMDVAWSTDYQEYHVVHTQIYGAKLYREDAAVVISTDEDGLV
jgi:hypothetical protein